MTDPRAALRAAYAKWLRVRVNVRALAASLAASEYALRRDTRGADPERATLTEQIGSQRSTIDALAAELDTRIAEVKAECDAIEASYVGTIRTSAERSPRLPPQGARDVRDLQKSGAKAVPRSC